ncbi:MAG: 16S rRNA (adenine(1518)-N(6)/adenine(1519)-N(6))-dimethyltransferase RsmA, partial [Actinomycetaceae bacterium]|nr:16S rRNA (adenine(1518)-N(6)/adenine(1519)-N(6))-dimethyltransferase RsmA [Actinomycetaceae bacterium]
MTNEELPGTDARASVPGTLLGPAKIRQLADTLGIRPTKTLGQNFVHDAGTVRRIVRDAGIVAGDQVLEVGPGLGSLTLALLETGALVSAVEIDPPLAQALPHTVAELMPSASDNFAVLTGDALDISGPEDLAVPTAVTALTGTDFAPRHLVANLPYNVAVPVLLTLLAALPTLETVTVMVQLEVADRLAAEPGSRTYGVPSVKARWYAQPWRGAKISRNVFWPVPNVDSALVHLRRRSEPSGVAREKVFEIVDAAFAQRRKTLRAALSAWAGSPARAEDIIRAAGIDPKLRGERLDIDGFVALARAAEIIDSAGSIDSTGSSMSGQVASEPVKRVVASAPAKVNLALRVGGPRPDGFHPLDTVFEALNIRDTITATLAGELSMTVSGITEGVPTDESNLVLKAARLLRQTFPDRGLFADPAAIAPELRADDGLVGAHLHVDKKIPVAGGMAGGSADAAAALVALNELWELGLTQTQLLELGAELGSDVPICIMGGIAHGIGRGELLTPVPSEQTHGWVMLTNPRGLSTPAVFRTFDDLRIVIGPPAPTDELREALGTPNTGRVAGLLANDLEPAARAMRPDLAMILDTIT